MKKIFSTLLTVLLLFSFFTQTVFAAENLDKSSGEIFSTANSTEAGSARILNGWQGSRENKTYYTNGVPASGLWWIGDKLYFFNKQSNYLQYNSGIIEGEWRAVDWQTGALRQGWFTNASNGEKYFYNNGVPASGFWGIGANTYYFNASSRALTTNSGAIEGEWRAVDWKTSALRQGWFTNTDGSRYYYTNGAPAKGEKTIDGTIYVFSKSSSELQAIKKLINGTWRYTHIVTGKNLSGWQGSRESKLYYADGVPASGLWWIENKLYYFDKQTHYLNYDSVVIEGEWRAVDWFTGAIRQGWLTNKNDAAKFYYKDGVPASGFWGIGSGTYYFNTSTKALTINSGSIEGEWRAVDWQTGALRQGWFTNTDGSRYHYTNGAPARGEKKIGDKTYVFSQSSCALIMIKQFVNGNWQYLDINSMPLNGWAGSRANKVYYSNGALAKGLWWVGDKLYFFNKQTGYLQYNSEIIEGEWRALDWNTGEVRHSWVTNPNGNKYHYINGVPAKGLTVIKDKTYYFNPADSVMQTGTVMLNTTYMEFDREGAFIPGSERPPIGRCIDVSAYQGNIDWRAAAKDGVTHAIIRALTWKGSAATGTWVVDPYFETNVKKAKSNGINVGAYIYTYAFNKDEVHRETAVFLGVANKLRGEGYILDLPVFIDYEYNKILSGVPTYQARTDLLRYQMQYLGANGYYPGMYMNTNWALNYVNAAGLQAEGYDLWVADYRGYLGYKNKVVGWQHSSKGSVKGIAGNVDENYWYKDYRGIIYGSNNYGQAA